ncbi:MAG: SDR family NAD(P)-dependent oxidoreductase [Candidatus Poseidoniales archaeon]|jgi:NAD(P)-dependent dehydrogenase (short-subunit alcohol dehydrogenase family)|tara:strand:+ start:5532 stop:6182 length:651 start_codon:yes stop_codon:yes gene_type:complete
MPRVMIVGANRGIGRALLNGYLDKGWECIATSRNDQDLEDNVTWIKLDVRDSNSHIPVAGELDLLICNAGVFLDRGNKIGSGFEAKLWEDTFATNVTGTYLAIEAQMGALRASKNPKIAIISSQMASDTTAPGGSYIYRSSKAASLNLGRNLATDLKSEGISVGIYHPGWVQTDMTGNAGNITASESADGLIERFSILSIETTGCFETWDGKIHPY